MENIGQVLLTFCTTALLRIVLAVVVFFIGRYIIRWVLKLLDKSKAMRKADGTVRTFVRSFVKIGLYCLLVIVMVSIMGVEMSSVAAVIASAGIAVGLALQGALSNLAGGIMLMIFKPFKVGSFVEASGASGTVEQVTMFYTVIITPDGKRVTIPNGSLMNANITDYSAQGIRRVDLNVLCAKSESASHVRDVIVNAIAECPLILAEPEGPFANVDGGTNEAISFAARAWCKSDDYWSVYFDMNQRITEALAAAGVKAPAVRIVTDR